MRGAPTGYGMNKRKTPTSSPAAPQALLGDIRALIEAARKVGLRLNMPLLPRATKSVVGSVLEREPVQMPGYQWDVSDPLACAGLYFGNGEEFRTGQAAGPGTIEEQWKVGGVQKAPYGPGTASWHRLIQGAQGTMGIVTWITIRSGEGGTVPGTVVFTVPPLLLGGKLSGSITIGGQTFIVTQQS